MLFVNLIFIYHSFHSGDRPLQSKGTRIKLDVNAGLAKMNWGCIVIDSNDDSIDLSIQTPPDCLVGKWKLSVETKGKKAKRNGEEKAVFNYEHQYPVYVLFNAWCTGG